MLSKDAVLSCICCTRQYGMGQLAGFRRDRVSAEPEHIIHYVIAEEVPFLAWTAASCRVCICNSPLSSSSLFSSLFFSSFLFSPHQIADMKSFRLATATALTCWLTGFHSAAAQESARSIELVLPDGPVPQGQLRRSCNARRTAEEAISQARTSPSGCRTAVQATTGNSKRPRSA